MKLQKAKGNTIPTAITSHSFWINWRKHTLISTLSYGVLIDVKSETVKANKYVDIFFVGKNSVISHSSSIVWEPERGNKADPYKERNVLLVIISVIFFLLPCGQKPNKHIHLLHVSTFLRGKSYNNSLFFIPFFAAFPRTVVPILWTMVTWNTALKSGSSKQGNTLLALVGSKLVAARNLWIQIKTVNLSLSGLCWRNTRRNRNNEDVFKDWWQLQIFTFRSIDFNGWPLCFCVFWMLPEILQTFCHWAAC